MADETYEIRTWKRTDLDLSNYIYTGTAYFLILDHEYVGDETPDTDQSILYSGLAPNKKIYAVNEIISQYIKAYLNFMDLGWTGWSRARPVFYVYFTEDDWETYYSIELKVTYDWTYDPTIEDGSFLSSPLSNVMDYRQYFVCTFQNSDLENPDSNEIYEAFFDGDSVITSGRVDNTIGTLRFYIQDWWTWDGNDVNYELYSQYSPHFSGIITDTCKEYCIYYMNRLGGWDWLLVDGKNLKTDKMTRLTYKQNYFPQVQTNLNKVPYVNTITETFEFTTSWMKDSDAVKISDLVESNKVVVHDLVNNIIYPVIMTNSSVEYKTYKNQGRKLYAYTLTMEASRPKYRVDACVEDISEIPEPGL